MSATNWAPCPRCEAQMQTAKAVKLQEARDGYGTLPIVEFDRLRDEADEMPTHQQEGRGMDSGGYSLREDYNGSCQIDENGVFTVHYQADCQRCGFSYKFNVDEDTRALTT